MSIDRDLISQEWPREDRDGIYFNNGSCGVKPRCVLSAIENALARQNRNPTLFTFLDEGPIEEARSTAAQLLSVEARNLILTQNSTFGLQLVMQSFLLKPGDELVVTDHEHGCVRALCQHLEQSRGIVVRRASVEPLDGSDSMTDAILSLVGTRTKLVEVSEIDCYTGWRPDLAKLETELRRAGVPLLVDGAHVPGQGPCDPARYPLWVGSGHKWLGGPNSTGFLHASAEYAERLLPVCVGDRFFLPEQEGKLTRFEWQGTADATRWIGLNAALQLQLRLGQEHVAARQKELVAYLRDALTSITPKASFRTHANMAEQSTPNGVLGERAAWHRRPAR